MERVDKHDGDNLHHIGLLGDDACANILKFLDNPTDLAHVAAVSRFWRRIVVESRLWRYLCVCRFPEVKMFVCVASGVPNQKLPKSGLRQAFSSQQLVFEHQVYSTFYKQLLEEPFVKSCRFKSLHASSTDHSPDESIEQTIYPGSRTLNRFPSYWSSKGDISPDVPESLTYELVTPLCVIHEIRIRPFQAYFQAGNPIYSAKFVRFRVGYSSSRDNKDGSVACNTANSSDSCGDYIWTYTSPEFPMAQADTLQQFKLQQPVLCVGGVLQIELLERVQTQQADGLYYICICHVDVHGTPIQGFNFEVVGGNLVLLQQAQQSLSGGLRSAFEETGFPANEFPMELSDENSLAGRLQQLRAIGFDRMPMDDLFLNEDEEMYGDDEEIILF